jgi:hypothetical protein
MLAVYQLRWLFAQALLQHALGLAADQLLASKLLIRSVARRGPDGTTRACGQLPTEASTMSVPRFAAEAVFENPLRLRTYRTPVRYSSAGRGMSAAAQPAQLLQTDELESDLLAAPDELGSLTEGADGLEELDSSSLMLEPESDPLLDEPGVAATLAAEPGFDGVDATDLLEISSGEAALVSL